MKVLVAAPYFKPCVGGLEEYARNISLGLASAGHAVQVVTANHRGWTHARDDVDGITVHRLPIAGRISNTPLPLLWAGPIDAVLEETRPDVVIGHTPVPVVADLVARRARRRHIPFVLTYHNDLVKPRPAADLLCRAAYSAFINGTLRLANRIVVTSHEYANESPYLRPHLTKVVAIPPGVDTDRFVPQEQGSPSPSVLFVGQLDRSHSHKGLADLMSAMCTVVREFPDARLRIAGKGDHVHAYRELAQRLGLEDHVEFLGFVPARTLPGVYATSSLLVLPSRTRSEGFGMVLLEAAAAGRPVVATEIGGIPAAVEDCTTGLLVPPGDVPRLAAAISGLLQSPCLARSMGEAGRKRVLEEFTWQRQVELHCRLLDQVAGNARVGAGR